MDPGRVLPAALIAIAGYAAGSLPASALVGRLAGVDIYRRGDGNPGASNVWALAGARLGILAALADVAKGMLPALLGWLLLGFGGAWVGGAAAVVGAAWPAIGRWRGGRAVAVTGGALIGLAPTAAVLALSAGGAAVAVLIARGRSRRRAAGIGLTAAFLVFPAAFHLVDDDPWHLAAVMTLYLLAGARYRRTRSRPAAPGRIGAPAR